MKKYLIIIVFLLLPPRVKILAQLQNTAGSDYTMDIIHLSRGIYFINIISNQRIINTGILKK